MLHAWYWETMAYWIKRIYRGGRNFRINVPLELIRAKGWEDVLYIKIEDQWGDRIVITRAGDHEETETKDQRNPAGDD